MRNKDSSELREAQEGIPIPVPQCPGVYHCGFHSEKSFGATSYLIVRPEGNIMMDTPRFTPVLAKKFEAIGGVATIVLSHMCASPSKARRAFSALSHPHLMLHAQTHPRAARSMLSVCWQHRRTVVSTPAGTAGCECPPTLRNCVSPRCSGVVTIQSMTIERPHTRCVLRRTPAQAPPSLDVTSGCPGPWTR